MSAQNIYQGFKLPPASERDVEEISSGDYDFPLTFTPSNVLDIGAHVGLFTKWARTRWPECRVTAYEPWAENAAMFRENLSADERVTLVEKACWPDRELVITEGQNSMTHTAFPEQTEFCKEQKRTIPAEIPQGKFDFIKMDCEGSEVSVIVNLDLSETKAIVVECHSAMMFKQVDDYLKSQGFLRLIRKFHGWRDVSIAKYYRTGACNPLPRKLMVCIPIYGDICGFTSQCILKLVQQPPVPFMLNYCMGDSLVSRARNLLTHQFLMTECTDMLFIDSDLIFSPDQIKRMVEHTEPVVGGLYPKKQDKEHVEWVLNTHKDLPPIREDGLQKVAYIGTGFIRVKRDVFEQMIEKYGDEIRYKDDCTPSIMHDFWPVGVYKYADGTARYLSEDWYFCQRWIDCGGEVFSDNRTVLKHVGTAIFPTKQQESNIVAQSPNTTTA